MVQIMICRPLYNFWSQAKKRETFQIPMEVEDRDREVRKSRAKVRQENFQIPMDIVNVDRERRKRRVRDRQEAFWAMEVETPAGPVQIPMKVDPVSVDEERILVREVDPDGHLK